MANEMDKKDCESRNLPQYGKKGHKPRRDYSPKYTNMDELHTNKIEYWNKTSAFNSVTKLPWGLIIGAGPDTSAFTAGGYLPTNAFNPAQVMVIETVVGPGWAESVDDGVNRGLALLMSKIRSTLSSSNIGYETADLGMLLASSASIANLIGMAKRLLEASNMWKDRNYVYPRYLIHALGDTYENIYNHINEYTARLNRIIDMYNGMNILDAFDIYGRQYAMAHSVFIDEDSELAQIYAFRHRNYYVYDDKTHQCVSTDLTAFTFNAICSAAEDAINAWYGSSDLYQINGTLLRAFKDAPRQQIPSSTIEDTITPTIDRDFLMQIMNMTIMGPLTNLNMTQDPTTQNYLIWKPYVNKVESTTPGSSGNATAHLLRLFENDIDQNDNMELTRLLNFARLDPANGEYALKNCGSEIVTEIFISSYDAVTGDLVLPMCANIMTNDLMLSPTNGYSAPEILQDILAISPFRYIPNLKIYYSDLASHDTVMGVVGDMYNWMVYSRDDWDNLQRVAYQSLWTLKL